MKIQQSLPNCLGDKPSHFGFAMEFYFAFCGMNIDIHCGRIDFEEEATDRITALHQRGMVTFKQSEIETAIFHRAAIDEQMLVFAGSARDTGRSHKSPKSHRG